MYDYGFEEEIMNIRDSVRGVITGQNKDGGLYIDMKIEDEESEDGVITVQAFGYWSGRVNREPKQSVQLRAGQKTIREFQFVSIPSIMTARWRHKEVDYGPCGGRDIFTRREKAEEFYELHTD